ncbi:MAG: CHC2 zinc finger domain-containing protein, partial [Chromatiales bacterium]|nr:CHC2 zinc finger domain-containing protein [Chromatiales bacterium]
MAGKIPQHFIDDLINRVDIVELIDSRVTLKKAGREYQACCPFHNEKSPSFTVSPSKQFYHCFGCGAHGTAIGFLMEYDRMEFVEAVEELAKMAGVEVPREVADNRARQDRRAPDLYELMERAANFYRQQLRSSKDASRAVEYLKGRGLSGEVARDFGVGYAPPGWDNLFKAMGGENPQLLLSAGLLVEKEGGKRYDKFRDRIMFPIRDRRGRVVGFGGRVLSPDD